MLRRIATVLGIALLGLVFLELVLQGFGLVAPRLLARERTAAGADAFRILCIGDSHTYGWGVERSEAYPARLEHQLSEAGTGGIEVVNLGVPSSNSSQVVTRLPRYLARYDPDLLIVTIGANDVSNFADREAAVSGRGLEAALWHLRSWRLLVYALHQRRKVAAAREAATAAGAPRPTGEAGAGDDTQVSWSNPWHSVELRDGAFRERFEHRVDLEAMLGPEEHAELLRGNLEKIVRTAWRSGVPVVFASYTHEFHSLAVANRVMSEVESALFVSQLVSELRSRAPELAAAQARERLFFEDLHPRAPVYDAAAEHLRSELVEAGLVPR